jgi:hypothetical protein
MRINGHQEEEREEKEEDVEEEKRKQTKIEFERWKLDEQITAETELKTVVI